MHTGAAPPRGRASARLLADGNGLDSRGPMRALRVISLLLLPALALAEPPCAEPSTVLLDGLGTPAADFQRVAELAEAAPLTSRLILRGGARTAQLCEGAAAPVPSFVHAGEPTVLRVLPLRLETVWNSQYPYGANDGLLWAGRGVSQLLSGGVAFRAGAFSAALAPEVTWSENRFFDTYSNGLPGPLRFGNAYYPAAIDFPQRFGAGPFATWGPGQSYLRVDHWNVAVGLSTENLWLGPGVRNAIILSNAGPGFPHAFLGTSRPADIWIGKAEALLFWGRLDRTDYIAGGGHPLVNGLALTYEPRWVPGLYLGFARMFTQSWKDLTVRKWLAVFQTLEKKHLRSIYPGGDNPEDNQIASLFARWVFPESGLEIYGEWAREDYNVSIESELRAPDHGQAFTLGLQKVFTRAGERLVRVHLETTVLQEMSGFGTKRWPMVYYIHPNDLGFTNRGQLLGAWIGPGGSSQTFAVDVFRRGGRIGGFVERVRRNDAYYWTVIEPSRLDPPHDVEMAAGVRQVLRAGPAEVSWEASAAFRWARDFIRDEPNFRLSLGLALPFAR